MSDSPSQFDADAHRWARLAVLRLLVRLKALIERGVVLPDDPGRGQ